MAARVGSTTPYYCLSDGASLPSFLSERQRRSMQKTDDALRQRVELLQDFGFPASSRRVRFSGDGRFVVAAGAYPPSARVYELAQLGMKYERRLGCECVDMLPLTPDLGKMVFLLADRTLDFHAPYGTHYKTRVPSHGRALAYDAARCELLVPSAKGKVHRMDLDEGRFLEEWSCGDDWDVGFEAIALASNTAGLPLAAVSGDDGVVRFWDSRCDARRPVAKLRVSDDEAATALSFDLDGLSLAVGTSGGSVHLFDVRSSQAYHTKEHQYGLPIVDVHFHVRSRAERHTAAKLVVSADAKLVKAWDAHTGEVVANVEPTAPVTHVTIAPAAQGGDSGLIVCAGEQPRVMAYYVPALGAAPPWCAFVDSLTEELEETTRGAAYDDYRFVTLEQLEEVGGAGLVGTPMLRAYMHGFFVDARLLKRLKSVNAPEAYDDWRQKKVKAKLDAKAASRIKVVDVTLPKVNARLASKLLEDHRAGAETVDVDDASDDELGERRPKKRDTGRTKLDAKKRAKRAKTADDSAPAPAPENPLGDSRFKAMFEDGDYEIDEQTPDYLLRHPNAPRPAWQQKKAADAAAAPAKRRPEAAGDARRQKQPVRRTEDFSFNKNRARATPTMALGLGGAAVFEVDSATKPLSKRLGKKKKK
ncbi:quinon protein alcohol dehydrogenase-like superfamily [Pelagophyceae sp. CCMP2097]|nr:quinon protein alcohol dehydrogenase-like superfamily [Pelagophyceae sp. CCMP2097]